MDYGQSKKKRKKKKKKGGGGGGGGAGDYCTVTKVGDCGSRTKIEQF